MIDIISNFAEYIDASGLHPTIRDAPELSLVRKTRQIEATIKDANSQLAAHAAANRRGATVIEEAVGVEDLKQTIQAEGARLEELVGITSSISEILEAEGVESIHQLRERRADCQNTLQTVPRQAWQAFLLARGEGKYDDSNRTSWLPSDIVQIPEFQALESRLRRQIEDAKASLEHIEPALQRLEVLIEEARAI